MSSEEHKHPIMSNILKDAPAYRWMTEDAREEERRTLLEQLRGTVLTIVTGRFPKYARLAKKQVRDVKSTESLQSLLVKISLAHETDDIEQYLWDLDEEDEPETL